MAFDQLQTVLKSNATGIKLFAKKKNHTPTVHLVGHPKNPLIFHQVLSR